MKKFIAICIALFCFAVQAQELVCQVRFDNVISQRGSPLPITEYNIRDIILEKTKFTAVVTIMYVDENQKLDGIRTQFLNQQQAEYFVQKLRDHFSDCLQAKKDGTAVMEFEKFK